ncbi:hypothetical protein BC938DRAFT_483740 [Jimgerdemannia flammicorona]|uniref:Uncharacterized protein n=1 Tax=Jimgerdemannia flammicorona TaxID=994334 RepID=A0A433QBG8_9FUNG|nr:hypothetical protein BC938DRAFT_483740 [Jimgerdemannia flammicorona]
MNCDLVDLVKICLFQDYTAWILKTARQHTQVSGCYRVPIHLLPRLSLRATPFSLSMSPAPASMLQTVALSLHHVFAYVAMSDCSKITRALFRQFADVLRSRVRNGRRELRCVRPSYDTEST